MSKLDKKLDKIPSEPGVYLFKDKKGVVLYVGKAANLKVRVRSYFRSSTGHSPAKNKLLKQIENIETQQTKSEIEALVKEAQLIKKLKPRFNVLMRDNKNYSYVVITKDKFPRIYITHQPNAVTGGRRQKTGYVGPFTEAKALKKTLRLLREIFPHYTRSNRPRLPKTSRPKTSALEIQLGLVPKEETTAKEYGKNIQAVKQILLGRRKSVVRDLEKEVRKAAKSKDFEKAKNIRDQISHLRAVIDHAHVLGANIYAPAVFSDQKPNFSLLGLKNDPERIEGYDISNFGGKEAVGSMVVFLKTRSGSYKPKKSEYKKFKIKTVKGANDPAMIKEVLSRRVKHLPGGKTGEEWPTPDLIVVDGGRAQLNAALKAVGNKNIRVISLAKRQEDVYMPDKKMPVRAESLGQATMHLLQALRDETHRFAITFHKSRRNKKVFE